VPVAVEKTTSAGWEALVAKYPERATPEHRRQQRRRNTAIGTVQAVFKQEGRLHVRAGKVLNVSPRGVLVLQREDVSWGTKVVLQVRLGNTEALLFGKVAHCTETVGGFKVGVELRFH
jgi:hypothetical protein